MIRRDVAGKKKTRKRKKNFPSNERQRTPPAKSCPERDFHLVNSPHASPHLIRILLAFGLWHIDAYKHGAHSSEGGEQEVNPAGAAKNCVKHGVDDGEKLSHKKGGNVVSPQRP